MVAIKASSWNNAAEEDWMVEMELDAAEALAGLAQVTANRSLIYGGESVGERVKTESDAGNSCLGLVESFSDRSIHLDEDEANVCEKDPEKTCIWSAKHVEDEQSTELQSYASYPTEYASSSGRKSRQTLTEAEKEARKIGRVLANRESARQTIRRRQAVYDELTRKAADLAQENKNLKKLKNYMTWLLLHLRLGRRENY